MLACLKGKAVGSAVVEAVVDYSVEVPLAVIEYGYDEGRGRLCLRCRNLAMGCQRLDHRSKEFPAEMDEVLRKHGNQVAVAGGRVLRACRTELWRLPCGE